MIKEIATESNKVRNSREENCKKITPYLYREQQVLLFIPNIYLISNHATWSLSQDSGNIVPVNAIKACE